MKTKIDMKYSTKIINMNFKIKVNGVIDGKKVNSLYGVSGVLKVLEQTKTFSQCQFELFDSIVEKALNCPKDKYQYKLRRGVKVVLYRF